MGELKLGWPNWIGVVAKDLEAQRRFYRDVLGFEERKAEEGFVEFYLGPGQKLELLALKEDVPQHNGVRYQTGFVVEDIRAAAKGLVARGVEQVSEIEGGGDSPMYWCYFRDPEGNLFEITQPVQPASG
ncbi:MAG TPA: VOC family protein [Actinomycetota bacterium]|jgi:catechol 2,3-dioxygenase-like lactoylglutathione lyase family enzyme